MRITDGALNRPMSGGWQNGFRQPVNAQSAAQQSMSFNGDELYKRYANAGLTAAGDKARNAYGNAIAATGGYDNSYAASAADNAYFDYIAKLKQKPAATGTGNSGGVNPATVANQDAQQTRPPDYNLKPPTTVTVNVPGAPLMNNPASGINSVFNDIMSQINALR